MEVTLVGEVELDEVVAINVKLDVTTIEAEVVEVTTPVDIPSIICTELELGASGDFTVAFPSTSAGVVLKLSIVTCPTVEAANHTNSGDRSEAIGKVGNIGLYHVESCGSIDVASANCEETLVVVNSFMLK